MTDTTLTAAPARTTLQCAPASCASPAARRPSRRCCSIRPGPGEVLVRIAAAGVCHSDVHLADGALGAGRWPMVLGHEGAGIVAAVGDGVTDVAPGDHVVVLLGRLVWRCAAACRVGAAHAV